jgi:ribosomal-protein-alanine N-acetyltransferase
VISTVQLRPARLEEARLLALMSRDWIETGLPWRWRTPQILRRIHDPESEVVVAREGHRAIGFAVMEFRFREREAHLLLLAVGPEQRRRGVGRELVDWLATLARAGGVERIVLEVRASRPGAREFYRRLGYRELGRLPSYYQGREDAIRVGADLRPLARRADS